MGFLGLLLSAALPVTIYGIFLVVYRLYFHPLRRFPGPKLAAATFWYEVYYDWFKGPYPGSSWNLDRLHDQYGPIIRKTPDELSIRDPDYVDVLFAGGRRDRYSRQGKEAQGSVQSTLLGSDHRRRRGALTGFFSKRSLDTLEPFIMDKVEQLSASVEENFLKTGNILEAGVAFGALTLDTITDYCFDQSFGCLSKPDLAPEWRRTFWDMLESIPFLKNWTFFAEMFFWVPQWVVKHTNPAMEQFFIMQAAIRAKVARVTMEWERDQALQLQGKDPFMKGKRKRTIFYDILNSAVLLPEDKTPKRMAEEAFGMVVAGGYTTGKAMANLMYHIHANPKWLEKVREELDSLMPSPGQPVKLSDLQALPCLTACIKENLRISNIITDSIMLVEPVDTLTYKDWVIPPKTPIGMTLYHMHMDERIFPEPKAFRPERWIKAAEAKHDLDKYFAPFSKGTRGCLGVNLANAQMYLGLGVILRRFDFQLFDVVKERDVDTVRDCFVGLESPESKGVRLRVMNKRE
ncbi:cytochrome P450 [Aspergillus foveolatus]|uniref:cytochrome P450 n=1 Tax=Aspergillus foveolatus TaxID=210207 RepID=UPI003CCD1197